MKPLINPDLFETLDINNLPIKFGDGFVLELENTELNARCNVNNDHLTDGEESLASRIHKKLIQWNNTNRFVKRTNCKNKWKIKRSYWCFSNKCLLNI